MPEADRTATLSLGLDPGEARSIDVAGPATIVTTRVRVAQSSVPALESISLRVRWDDSSTDAIALSLGDLFASANAAPESGVGVLSARPSGADVELRVALPMPFASRAHWVVRNEGPDRIDGELVLDAVDALPRAPWGALHTDAHETLAPATEGTHTLARAEGRGKLVGVCAVLRGHGPEDGPSMAFLEGNAIGVVDGADALVGTGTEDYFDAAFFFADGARSTPFAQVWGIRPQLPGPPDHAAVSACRWHVFGDAVDFERTLDLRLEVSPRAFLDAYRSVAFIYR